MASFSQRLGLTRYQADEYYASALDAYEKAKYTEAIEQMNYAITLLPLNSEYYAARGLFHLQAEDLPQARADFEHALRLHDGEMLANYGMGIVSFHAHEWAQALGWFNKARAVNPLQPEIPYYVALVYHRQQDNENAKAHMQTALDLFEAANDKRKADARRWIKEFEKLLRYKVLPPRTPESLVQQRLLNLDAPPTAGAPALPEPDEENSDT